MTTTDESGKYELPDLAPGTYTVEVQMFGFQTAHKEMQIGPGALAPGSAAWSGVSICSRASERVAERPQRQQAGFRATTENEVDQIAAAPPPDTVVPDLS